MIIVWRDWAQNKWKTSSFVTVMARSFEVSRRNFRKSWMKKCAIDLNPHIMNCFQDDEMIWPKLVKNLKFCHCCDKGFCGVETEFQENREWKKCAIDLNRNIMNDYCLERLGPKLLKTGFWDACTFGKTVVCEHFFNISKLRVEIWPIDWGIKTE